MSPIKSSLKIPGQGGRLAHKMMQKAEVILEDSEDTPTRVHEKERSECRRGLQDKDESSDGSR